MSLYDIELTLHSWLRWALLVSLVALIYRALVAHRSGKVLTAADEKLHVATIALADVQLTLGLVLYLFESPWTQAFRAAPGLSMKNSVLRFFGVEHITMMLIGIALLHLGRALAKKTPAEARPKRVFRYTLAALLFILGGVPWPFLPAGRPLFRADSHQRTGLNALVAVSEPGRFARNRDGSPS